MNTRQVIKLVADDGWYEIKTSGGGHRQYRHPVKQGKVTIPFHGKNSEVPPFLFKSIKKQAGLK